MGFTYNFPVVGSVPQTTSRSTYIHLHNNSCKCQQSRQYPHNMYLGSFQEVLKPHILLYVIPFCGTEEHQQKKFTLNNDEQRYNNHP